MSQNRKYSENRIWANVMQTAVEDCVTMNKCLETTPELRSDPDFRQSFVEVRNWFCSSSDDMGSFIWICRLFGWSPDKELGFLKEYLNNALVSSGTHSQREFQAA
ncbi:MAG: hypothetical protein HQL53_02570 [Magnetococcales bacterium]|nr:hypothetical protein [Magnetococcales bacterium]